MDIGFAGTSTYQNIPVNKYRSLPPNISPVTIEQAKYDKISLSETQNQTTSANSIKSSEDDNISQTDKKAKKKKRSSFFRRNK